MCIRDRLMITSDYNFVNVDFFVEYKVTDPVKAIYNSQSPELILKNIAQGCIRSVVASYDVDSVLTTGKSEIQSNIKQLIVGKLEEQDLGIALVNITIQDSEPPTAEVMEAFKAVAVSDTHLDVYKRQDVTLKNWPQRKAEGLMHKVFMDAKADYVEKELDLIYEGRLDTWDYQLMLDVYKRQNQYCLPSAL